RRLDANEQLVEVSYTDRYISRPLTARTVYEVLRALRALPGGIGEHTVLDIATLEAKHAGGYPDAFDNDWEEPEPHRAALQAIADAVGCKARPVFVGSKSKVAHYRELKLRWLDDTRI